MKHLPPPPLLPLLLLLLVLLLLSLVSHLKDDLITVMTSQLICGTVSAALIDLIAPIVIILDASYLNIV